MKHRLKILKKLEKEYRDEIQRLKSILFDKPADDFIQVQKEFATLLEKYTGRDRFKDEFLNQVESLSEKEKKAREKMKSSMAIDRNKISEDLADAELELQEVLNDIYFVERSISELF